MDNPNYNDDCRGPEEEVDIKFHTIKVEEEDYNLDGDEEEYILGLDEHSDLNSEQQDDGPQRKNFLCCNQCVLQFQSRLDLTTHQIDFHPPPFSCSVCSQWLFTSSGFLRHVQLRCREEMGKRSRYGCCTRCGKPFKSRTDRSCHSCAAKERREKERRKIECIQETFLTELSPSNIEENSSSANTENRQVQRMDKASQMCLICGSILSSSQGGLQHVRRHHKNEVRMALASGMPSSVACDQCGLQCYDERALQSHRTWKHTDRNPVE